MTDNDLQHLCRIGTIAVDAIRNPKWDLRECDDDGEAQLAPARKTVPDAHWLDPRSLTTHVRVDAAGSSPASSCLPMLAQCRRNELRMASEVARNPLLRQRFADSGRRLR